MIKTLAPLALALSCLASQRHRCHGTKRPSQRRQGACAQRQAARRHQLRQYRAGAKGPRRRRAARRVGGARARAGQAARRSDRIRHLRRRRQGVRRAQGRSLGRRLPGHRSRSLGRDRVHRPVCRDRGRLSGPVELAAADQRGRRPRRRARRGGARQRLRPLPHARAQARPAGAGAERTAGARHVPEEIGSRPRPASSSRSSCSPRIIRTRA